MPAAHTDTRARSCQTSQTFSGFPRLSSQSFCELFGLSQISSDCFSDFLSVSSFFSVFSFLVVSLYLLILFSVCLLPPCPTASPFVGTYWIQSCTRLVPMYKNQNIREANQPCPCPAACRQGAPHTHSGLTKPSQGAAVLTNFSQGRGRGRGGDKQAKLATLIRLHQVQYQK